MTAAVHFFDLTRDELREMLGQRGMPTYRADQVVDWVYQKKVADPSRMTNLSKSDRQTLTKSLRFTSGDIVRHQIATDGVQKLLMQWEESPESRVLSPESKSEIAEARVISLPTRQAGHIDTHDSTTETHDSGIKTQDSPLPDPRRQTECVMIPVDEDDGDGGDRSSARRTACISSQVGCPVGCRFCASGLGGLDGDLSAGRIVEQVWRLGTLEGVGRISNVVFMGMGEPLANFNNVAAAIRTLNADWGLGISARRITISTVGLPAQMRRLADLEIPVTLAISLHAPNDAIRKQLIPWANYVSIEQLLDAGRYYFERTGREITLEYILLGGVNDQQDHARQLVSIARSLRANVNLIRYNEVKGLPFDRPHTEDVLQFQTVLRNARVNVHIRASRGRDIAAACGQLRHEHSRVTATA